MTARAFLALKSLAALTLALSSVAACSSDTSNPTTFASVQEFAIAYCQRSYDCSMSYPGGDKDTCVRLQVGDLGFDLESACDAAWHKRCNDAMAKAPCVGTEVQIPSVCREECH